MTTTTAVDDDSVLLARFVETGCQDSFQQITARHGGWVFSVALRAVRDRHLAEDVTQAVFIILARKAKTIREGTPLSGWLFKACRFAVSDALKRRTRMKNRENRFAEFFKATNGGEGATDTDAAPGDNPANIPDEISHTLDEAVAVLSEADRQAVLLRFYEGKSLAEVGQIMNTSEEAAKKRVARAVEKLRKQFAKRGVIATAVLILSLLNRRSAEAATINLGTLAPSAAPSICHAIADGDLTLMAHAQAKLLGAILAAGLAILVAAPTLGGAVIRYTTGNPDGVAAKPLASESIAYDSEQSTRRTGSLPKESKFTDVWIAHKGQILWRSDSYTSDNPLPFYLKNAERRERPYAVAVDKAGEFFIKPLDKALIESPIVRDGRYDYDNGPTEPAARVNQVLTLIDAHDDGFNLVHPQPRNAGPVSSIRGTIGDKVKRGEAPAAESDWYKLQHHILPQGTTQDVNPDTVIVEQDVPMMQLRGLMFESGPALNFDYIVAVPEPTGATLLALGAATLLTRRRRRFPE